MKKFPILFAFFYLACATQSSTVKQSVLELKEAEIIELDLFYVFSTKNYLLKIPYSWRSYVEPEAKEQIRHSPYDSNVKKINGKIYITVNDYLKSNGSNVTSGELRNHIKNGPYREKIYFMEKDEIKYKQISRWYVKNGRVYEARIVASLNSDNSTRQEAYQIFESFEIKLP